jgi:U5 small nuclear ribonucleoprotein component
VACAARLSDGAVLVVDVIEGVMANTEYVIRHLMAEKIPIVLVVNKVDRLILELRLPPSDAYYKLKQTIEEVNTIISAINPDPALRVSPELGNVAFASTSMGWSFTLKSFAKMYRDTYGGIDIDEFAQRLWGNVYYLPESRKFSRREALDGDSKRSFLHFILEPLYKLYTQVLSADQETLKKTLKTLGIVLKPHHYKLDVKPLLRLVLFEFFSGASSTGLVDMIVEHIPNPIDAAPSKVRCDECMRSQSERMARSNPSTLAHSTRLLHSP